MLCVCIDSQSHTHLTPKSYTIPIGVSAVGGTWLKPSIPQKEGGQIALYVQLQYTKYINCMYQSVSRRVRLKKVSKTIRLSEEAVEVLSKHPNQSQHIEDLILGKGEKAPWLDLEYRIDELKELIKNSATQRKKERISMLRGEKIDPAAERSDILRTIKSMEAARDSELEYVQDEEYAAEITQKYATDLNELWDRFRELA